MDRLEEIKKQLEEQKMEIDDPSRVGTQIPPQYQQPQRPVQQSQQTPQQQNPYHGEQKKDSKDIIVGEIPSLDSKDRLIVKQVSFKMAMKLYVESQDLEGVNYDELLGKLQRATIDFFKIIVAKNEDK